jgi:polyisoprenoid-binding protein YceI
LSTITTETRSGVPTGTWMLDPVHSSVGFEVGYLVGTFRGQFRDVAAQLAVNGRDATLTGTARVASVDVKDENLAAHLASPDFFDAERHPELRFASRSIAGGDEVAIDGEITIKGVTRPVELTGTITEPTLDAYGKERIGLKVSTTIDRTDFGVDWNAPLPTGKQALANEVLLVAELYFVREA